MVRVGIIGSGVVGQTPGAKLVSLGHEVKVGSRDPSKLAEGRRARARGASAGTFDEAAAHGEVVILATLWEGTRNALELCGPGNLAGKVR